MASPTGLVALAMGIFVAYLGGRGVEFLTSQPQVMSGSNDGYHFGCSLLPGCTRGAPHCRRYGGAGHGTVRVWQVKYWVAWDSFVVVFEGKNLLRKPRSLCIVVY